MIIPSLFGGSHSCKKKKKIAKYCIVTFNAKTKVMTKKDKTYSQIMHQPKLSRKMYLLITLSQKDKNIAIKEFQLW